ncbi:MAG: hypothetical protein ACLQVY_23890 [Limisphaerales bacterium]
MNYHLRRVAVFENGNAIFLAKSPPPWLVPLLQQGGKIGLHKSLSLPQRRWRDLSVLSCQIQAPPREPPHEPIHACLRRV